MTSKEKLITAPVGTTMEEAQALLRDHRIEKLPLLDDDGNLAGLITSTDILKRRLFPDASKDEKGRLLVGAAIGVQQNDLKRAEALVEAECDLLVIDIAHGHSDLAIKTVEELKKRWPDVEVMAGNVATPEGVKDLIKAGADAVKVGVGPGSICITRLVAGSGVPQFTAIQNCAAVAQDAGVPIISDGGIRGSGDIVKALGAGASTVMIGSLLGGTDESPGFTIVRNGRKYKVSRGMASLGATMGREAREKKSKMDDAQFEEVVPEGVEAMVPYRGSVVEVVRQLVGGLRSGMSYSGAHSIEELQQVARFIRQTGAGQKESGTHDVEALQ